MVEHAIQASRLFDKDGTRLDGQLDQAERDGQYLHLRHGPKAALSRVRNRRQARKSNMQWIKRNLFLVLGGVSPWDCSASRAFISTRRFSRIGGHRRTGCCDPEAGGVSQTRPLSEPGEYCRRQRRREAAAELFGGCGEALPARPLPGQSSTRWSSERSWTTRAPSS